MSATIFDIGYLAGCTLLILGLRGLSHPTTAIKGNKLASLGIGLGIVISLFYPVENPQGNYAFILGGILIGTVIGLFVAKKVAMTAMPEMVSLFNGFGGLCALLISIVWVSIHSSEGSSNADAVIVFVNVLIGGVAFMGSLLAYGKLSGKVKDKHVRIPFAKGINFLFLFLAIGIIVLLSKQGFSNQLFIGLIILSVLYGVTFVAPIGGADMPVVISLLNSFTGVTAAISGVITGDRLMLLGGVLVGSAGSILTILMCKAMNRSLLNVIVGSFSGKSAGGGDDGDKTVKEIGLSDLAIQLAYSSQVAFIPGYGMAVSKAQKHCKELENVLSEKGVDVKYCIHPVAGRMPGHMNVLLAEADVEYGKLLDLDDANDFLSQTDVSIIVGANDVVNPAAKDDPSSNIYGMPILESHLSKQVVVLKRSMNKGYAGIENPLFFKENTNMLFGDAKESLQQIINEIKNI